MSGPQDCYLWSSTAAWNTLEISHWDSTGWFGIGRWPFFSNGPWLIMGWWKFSAESFGKLLTGWVVNKRYFSTSELCSANGKLVIWIPGIPFWKGLVPRSTPIRIPNHRAPNHQFTLSWCVCECKGRIQALWLDSSQVFSHRIRMFIAGYLQSALWYWGS